MVGEQGDVLLAGAAGGLVHAHRADPAHVLVCLRLLDVMAEQGPEAGVMLPHQAGHSPDGHLPAEREHERLEQQGEAAAGARPGTLHGPDAAVFAGDAREACVQQGPVLKEVQVSPGAVGFTVIDGARGGAARAGKAAALWEVQAEMQFLGLRVEVDPDDLPG